MSRWRRQQRRRARRSRENAPEVVAERELRRAVTVARSLTGDKLDTGHCPWCKVHVGRTEEARERHLRSQRHIVSLAEAK